MTPLGEVAELAGPIVHASRPEVDRGALLGAAISTAFGVGWAQWAATGIHGRPATAIRFVGVTIGLLLVIRIARVWKSASPTSAHEGTALFASRGYLVVVMGEVLSLGIGNRLLAATGHGHYAIAWTAVVIGVHFLAFGRLFFAGFYWLGGALIVGGIAGALVGVVGGGSAGITSTTGLIAAGSLLAASGWPLLAPRPITE